MTLICPACGSDRFEIRDAVELGPGAPYDERTVQRGACPACHEKFICLYLETRTWREDRDDEVRHIAYLNQSLLWFFAGLVFTRPSRRRAKAWRRRLARFIFQKCHGPSDNPALTIEYRATARTAPPNSSTSDQNA